MFLTLREEFVQGHIKLEKRRGGVDEGDLWINHMLKISFQVDQTRHVTMNESLQEIQPTNGIAGNSTLTEASELDISVDSCPNATNKMLQDEVQVTLT